MLFLCPQYVIPFMLNQVGSITYIVAMQRAPLTLAVPAANSLAFAFTALTGAAIGDEEPLDASKTRSNSRRGRGQNMTRKTDTHLATSSCGRRQLQYRVTLSFL